MSEQNKTSGCLAFVTVLGMGMAIGSAGYMLNAKPKLTHQYPVVQQAYVQNYAQAAVMPPVTPYAGAQPAYTQPVAPQPAFVQPAVAQPNTPAPAPAGPATVKPAFVQPIGKPQTETKTESVEDEAARLMREAMGQTRPIVPASVVEESKLVPANAVKPAVEKPLWERLLDTYKEKLKVVAREETKKALVRVTDLSAAEKNAVIATVEKEFVTQKYIDFETTEKSLKHQTGIGIPTAEIMKFMNIDVEDARQRDPALRNLIQAELKNARARAGKAQPQTQPQQPRFRTLRSMQQGIDRGARW